MLRRFAFQALRPTATAARPTLTRSYPKPVPSASSTSSAQIMATPTSPTSTSFDPQTVSAQEALDEGTRYLEQGDFEKAATHYKKSIEIKETAIAHYNLGVVQYQLQQLPPSIASFEKSLSLTDPSVKPTLPDPAAPLPELTPAQIILADTHTNLGAAYILSKPPRPEKALEHLQKALMINPDDGEVCYNLAAVLEATGELDEAMIAFERAQKLGIERAQINIRNLGGKILAKKREEAEKEQEKK
ncbi:tetratricopeptide repeat protein [Sporobolomyces salmoneus]|uniref:tetratricopeptide repeat protein n=1 Tax=Sporobolomyces salmoneus TaxID=183962 RepID=UPI003176DCFE